MSGYILAVDDNPNNLRLLISLLSGQGHEVRPATSGPRALATAAKEPPELILLDVNMPEMDGYAVCRQLKADASLCDIPVLFVSAKDEVPDKVRGFEAGAVDYLSKPFDPQELQARVKTHLELKRTRDQLQQMNVQLQSANAGLEGLNRIKDEFLAMVSHELKNPLSSILLFSRYMESRSLSEDKAREIGQLITRASQRMFQLIEDLLEIHQLEQGQLHFQPEPVGLASWLAELAQEYSEKARHKQQELLLAIDLATELRLQIDPQRLRQVLENLLSNALKFSPAGSQIQLAATGNANAVLIAVSDSGPGLSSQDQTRVFQKFARLSAQPTGGEHSSGLGLYISQQLMQAMGGELRYRAQAPAGACFELHLPLAIFGSGVSD